MPRKHRSGFHTMSHFLCAALERVEWGVYMRKESLLFAVTSACSRRAVPSVLLKWKVASHSYQGTQATIFPYCDIYSMGHAEFSEVMLELRQESEWRFA